MWTTHTYTTYTTQFIVVGSPKCALSKSSREACLPLLLFTAICDPEIVNFSAWYSQQWVFPPFSKCKYINIAYIDISEISCSVAQCLQSKLIRSWPLCLFVKLSGYLICQVICWGRWKTAREPRSGDFSRSGIEISMVTGPNNFYHRLISFSPRAAFFRITLSPGPNFHGHEVHVLSLW